MTQSSPEDVVARDGRRPRVLLPRLDARALLALASGVLLVTATVVGAVRSPRVPARAAPPPASPRATERLTGAGPFVLYATPADDDAIEVRAVDVSALTGAERPRSLFLGRYAGRLNDFAGSQGLAAGKVVPMLAVDAAADQNTRSTLWLFRRDASATSIFTTSDLVAGYAFDRDGTRFALGRRAAHSATPGTMLWVHEVGGRGTLVGSLRRPNGTGVRDALRPVAWAPGEDAVVATPFCDACEALAGGVYRYTVRTRSAQPYPALPEDETFVPGFTPSGDRFVVARARRMTTCQPPATIPYSEALRCLGGEDLVVVETVSSRARSIASSDELRFEHPTPSPSGRVVAYASGRDHAIEWRDMRTGRLVGIVDFPAVEFQPAAWVSESRLIAVAGAERLDPALQSDSALVLVSRGVLRDGTESVPHVDVLAAAPGITYLGWIA